MSMSSELTENEKRSLIAKIDRRRREGMTVVEACDHEGIKQATYFSWRRKFDLGPYSAGEAAAVAGPVTDLVPVPAPDLTFLDFRGMSLASVKEQLGQVTRERDELRRILFEILSGMTTPAGLLEGMFRSHIEERIRASKGGG